MIDFNNIFLYEHSAEAIEAVKSGEARISAGGVINVKGSGRGFKELARPASLSVADIQSLFENNNHKKNTDNTFLSLKAQLCISEQGMKEIENISWLNYDIVQRTYTVTYEGFKQTLKELKTISNQISVLEEYTRRRETKNLLEKVQTYLNFLNTDASHLRSKVYNVTNGQIAEHLDQIAALLKILINDIENDEDDVFVKLQIVSALLSPFSYIAKKYTAAYFYENDGELMPGNSKEWMNIISSVSRNIYFKDKLEYYIKLKTTIPFKDKMIIIKALANKPTKLLSGMIFEKKYIINHTKDEYLKLDEQIAEKIESKDYIIKNGNLMIFLESSTLNDVEING